MSNIHIEWIGDLVCHSAEEMVDIASKIKVDIIIISGDLFEDNGKEGGIC
jgi:DNA repair exonuclease SbcCD nuclease subunit